MNKRIVHHIWARIRPIKSWYFLIAAAVCAAIGVAGLRSNYQHMVILRQAVYAADQQNGNVEKALQDLRAYVGSHMNTSLTADNGVYPPIQLKYTYQRLQVAEKARADSINSQIYTDAQHYCESLYPGSFSGGPRVPCIEQYVKNHGTIAQSIPDAMYKFNFASADWSPDLAGIGLGLTIAFGVLAVLRLALGLVLKNLAT